MISNWIWRHKAADNYNLLDDVLTVNDEWKNNRNSIIARYKGIKETKEHTHNEVTNLLRFGKKLPYAVVFVSAIHIWEIVARIAPNSVPQLKLDPFLYHTSALVFILLIDVIIVYIKKAYTALAQVKVKESLSIWFFYVLTALLNAAFIAANSQDANSTLKNLLVEVYNTLFLFMLPITIPIAINSIEESNKKLQAFKVLLMVDIATFTGLIEVNDNKGTTVIENKTLIVSTPIDTTPKIGTVDTLENVVTQNKEADKIVQSKVYRCAKCDALMPTSGNAKTDQGAWLATNRFGCKVCKTKV